jgi:hypothetical protein
MILPMLGTGTVASVAIYLGGWRISVHRRRTRAWNILMAQLQPKQCARELSNQFSSDEKYIAAAEDMWQRLDDAHDLWRMFENAGVILDMVDYATRNGKSVNCELFAALRDDAMQIRSCVLTELAQNACSQVSEKTSMSVSRVATLYADMVARTAEVMRANGGSLALNLAVTI